MRRMYTEVQAEDVAISLFIKRLADEDAGQYRCTARNEVGELSVTIHLQVEPPLVVGRTAGHWSVVTPCLFALCLVLLQ